MAGCSRISHQLLAAAIFWTFFTLVVNEEVPTDRKDVPRYSFLMPAIIWDPRNPLFNCPSRGINTINVRMNDYVIFGCPAEGKNLEWFDSASTLHSEMYENGFLTENKTLLDQCNATSFSKKFLNCNNPKSPIFRTIRVAQMVASDDEPIFAYNKEYYLFGTGTGRVGDIDQRQGGRCAGQDSSGYPIHKLRLKLKVCAEGEAGTANCPICLTADCYNKGCGNITSENTTHYHKIDYLFPPNNAAKASPQICKKIVKRNCSNSVTGCPKSSIEEESIECPRATTEPICDETWTDGTQTFYNQTGSCFRKRFKNCTVGSLEKYNFTKLEIYRVQCPPTTAPPTTMPPSIPLWQNVSGGLKYLTNKTHCFRLQQRKYESCRQNITEMRILAAPCPSPSTSVLPTSSSSAYSRSVLTSCSAQTTTVVLTSTIVSVYSVEATKSCASTSLAREAASTLGSSPQTSSIGSTQPTKSSIPEPSSTGPAPPSGGKSTGNAESSDAKSYIIPVVSAIFGCICGALAVWYYMHLKQKRVSTDDDILDSGSSITMVTDTGSGIKNKGYRMSTLKASQGT
ncbi:uncharacterized protein LOC135693539 isoform X2 [Rhopilema esculentum]|uniref:uncharacterized protein LOC135693539 isoform X2 n=1 Tax=Rhopilema esculentum TaxID=499914 RepID=UPI0031DD725D